MTRGLQIQMIQAKLQGVVAASSKTWKRLSSVDCKIQTERLHGPCGLRCLSDLGLEWTKQEQMGNS